jgi:replicative DNA helicase
MTAEPKPRPLSLVAQDPEPDWRAESVLRHWDPEAQLVGALMHLPAATAVPILELVPDTAIWRPDNRWAVELIRHIVETGADPDPVVVLNTARHRPPADAAPANQTVSAQRHHGFAVHLAELYTRTVTPSAAPRYAREVLDDAYRRAVGFHGIRLTHLAETGAPRDELTDYLTAMRTELADLWRRADAATGSR